MSSTNIKPLPDVDLAVLSLGDLWLGGQLAAAASWRSPTPGSDPLPWMQAYTFDGEADQLSGEVAVDVHFFALRYGQASLLARTFDARFMGYPHVVGSPGSAVLLDKVRTISVPTEVEWLTDNSVRRFQATYSVSFRR